MHRAEKEDLSSKFGFPWAQWVWAYLIEACTLDLHDADGLRISLSTHLELATAKPRVCVIVLGIQDHTR